MKYIYPAIFTCLENGEYSIRVPDLPGCITCGKNLNDALDMAQDAISMWVCDAEDSNERIPEATNILELECGKSEFKNLISINTDEYRKLNDNRAIKKTLTIPNWLNTKAEKAGVNFSQVLQEALKDRLQLEKQ